MRIVQTAYRLRIDSGSFPCVNLPFRKSQVQLAR